MPCRWDPEKDERDHGQRARESARDGRRRDWGALRSAETSSTRPTPPTRGDTPLPAPSWTSRLELVVGDRELLPDARRRIRRPASMPRPRGRARHPTGDWPDFVRALPDPSLRASSSRPSPRRLPSNEAPSKPSSPPPSVSSMIDTASPPLTHFDSSLEREGTYPMTASYLLRRPPPPSFAVAVAACSAPPPADRRSPTICTTAPSDVSTGHLTSSSTRS